MLVLSQAEEERLVAEYSKIAWKFVHRFADGKGSSIFSPEDLYQECMVVLIAHRNRCETREQLKRIQTMEIVNAMCRFVLRNQALRLDANRTNQIKRILGSCAKKVALEKAEHLAYDGTASLDMVVEETALEQFVENDAKLGELERIAVQKKREGRTVGEIAEFTGRSHQMVSHALKTARKKYDRFIA